MTRLQDRWPKTLKEARAKKYGLYHNSYTEGRCAAEVWESGRGIHYHQCFRNNGHGPDNLYCVQHAPLEPTGKYLYGIDDNYGENPKLVQIAILKETEKTLFLDGSDRSRAFDHKERLPKNSSLVHRTPEEAWEAYTESLRRKIESRHADIRSFEELLILAEKERDNE